VLERAGADSGSGSSGSMSVYEIAAADDAASSVDEEYTSYTLITAFVCLAVLLLSIAGRVLYFRRQIR